MAPLTSASDENTHQTLLNTLDIYSAPKPFRNASWKPPQRRNKNTKAILADAARKESSQVTTANSGTSTPAADTAPPNIAQAAQRLDRLVLEKSLIAPGPAVTYTNIEAAPSLRPERTRHYCDVTGLVAPYTDPKTRLRYHNVEVFNLIRTMGSAATEGYLEARGAHTVLK
ncbi:hypothetical protein EJ06DRAFT_496781 [Trichodelitschia bisporula]|uniref:Vps72/YL1 C-terminal domain-containing protein n=1 Tax=Trichodelitschia bisporula TaxID=703511 RepID=A0A6G1HQI1_9PEZI|nr:hypothetical protein EJ06DRAFT_496781 [Trichodelitschia bisporula]